MCGLDATHSLQMCYIYSQGKLTTFVMMAISGGLAVLIAGAAEISLSAMVAAAAPGGLAEMAITAQVLGLGVPLVTAYHIVRIIMITLFTLPLFRLARRLADRA